MRGIILAGGTGSRLYPLTKVINKHLIPICNKPMIYYSIEKLVNAGITEILIISGIEHCGSIIQQLGDGSDFNCKLTYKVQIKAGGIAEALLLAEDWARDDSITVILGDNISNVDLTNYISQFEKDNHGCVLFLKEVADPERFGVAEFYKKMSMKDSQVRITNIEEKPKNPKSKFAVTGFYIYDQSVFDRIKTLNYSARGELEVTDLNKTYLNDNLLTGFIFDNNVWWTDAGTHESLQRAHELIYNNKKSETE
jgi:glucose-1-phosphate thymidylyltransferase